MFFVLTTRELIVNCTLLHMITSTYIVLVEKPVTNGNLKYANENIIVKRKNNKTITEISIFIYIYLYL